MRHISPLQPQKKFPGELWRQDRSTGTRYVSGYLYNKDPHTIKIIYIKQEWFRLEMI